MRNDPHDPTWTDTCCLCGEDFYRNEDNGIEVVFVKRGQVQSNYDGKWIVCDACLDHIGVKVEDGRLVVVEDA